MSQVSLPPTIGATPTLPDSTNVENFSGMVPPQVEGSRYQPVRWHARGGLGELYVARDVECGREVALKTLQRERDNAANRARFLREAAITAQLQHPGIVPVYGVSIDAEGRPQYAMQFISGETLEAAVLRFHAADESNRDSDQRTLELRQLLTRFYATCQAVGYAHSRNVLHRDLKPSNVMLGQFGETLVVDWGLAKILGEATPSLDSEPTDSAIEPSLTQAGNFLGTPAYVSPEQAMGRLDDLTPASDVYSLGATLYFLLTGRQPFQDTDLATTLKKVEQGDFPRPRSVKKQIPRALEAIVLKAMALRPDDRYPTAQAFADDVGRWGADECVTAWREPWSETYQRLTRRYASFVGGVTLAMMLVAPMAYHFFLKGLNQTSTSASLFTSSLQSNLELLKENTRLRQEKHEASKRKLALQLLLAPFMEATLKLGRPPKNAEELKPFVKRPEDLQDPILAKPYEIDYSVNPFPNPGEPRRPLAWESVPDNQGGRWVLFTSVGVDIFVEYVGPVTFGQLRRQAVEKKKAPAPPQPAPFAAPAPPVNIVPVPKPGQTIKPRRTR